MLNPQIEAEKQKSPEHDPDSCLKHVVQTKIGYTTGSNWSF